MFQIRHFTNRAGEEVVTFGLRIDGTLVPLEDWPDGKVTTAYLAAEVILGKLVHPVKTGVKSRALVFFVKP